MMTLRIVSACLGLCIAWMAGAGFGTGADQGIMLFAVVLALLSLAGRG